MPASGVYGSDGFRVVADNALELIVGTEAAGAGHVSANVQKMARTLDTGLSRVGQRIDEASAANLEGLQDLIDLGGSGLAGLHWLGGASLLVQAVGFATVASKLDGVRGEVAGLREDLQRQGEQLLAAQEQSNRHLASLEDFASRSLETTEAILRVLASSRRVEAQQLIEQGWTNLVAGYRSEAQERFEASLEYDNTVYLAHAALGDLRLTAGDQPEAEAHLNKAVDFSAAVGGEAVTFSRLRLATFLLERGRTGEVMSQLVQLQSADPSGAVLVRIAELAAEAGARPFALSAVRRAIESDPSTFVQVMGSKELASLGADLVALLTSLDAERRTPVLAGLEAAMVSVECLVAWSTACEEFGSRAASGLARLRESGAALLERALVEPYAALDALKVEVTEYAAAASGEVERLSDQFGDDVFDWFRDWVSSYEVVAWPWTARRSPLASGLIVGAICLALAVLVGFLSLVAGGVLLAAGAAVSIGVTLRKRAVYSSSAKKEAAASWLVERARGSARQLLGDLDARTTTSHFGLAQQLTTRFRVDRAVPSFIKSSPLSALAEIPLRDLAEAPLGRVPSLDVELQDLPGAAAEGGG